MERTELYPGVALNYQKDDRFKNEYLSIDFVCPPGLYERAHAQMLSAILEKGTAKRKSEAEIENALLDLYGASVYLRSYSAGETCIQPFALTVMKERFLPERDRGTVDLRAAARDLLFEHIFEPKTANGAFDRRIVAAEKKNKLAMLKVEKANKPRYAAAQCLLAMCEGEPIACSRAQYAEALRAVTPQSLAAYFESILDGAPIEIFYFGEEELSSLSADLTRRLSRLFTPKRAFAADVVSKPKDEPARKVEKLRAEQSVICLGFKTGQAPVGKNYAAFRLMREILCDSPLSLLFTDVRETRGLCYFCSSLTLAGKGVYMIEAGIERRAASETEKAILENVGRMKAGDFPDELLAACKRSLINALKETRDDPVQTEALHLRETLRGGRFSIDALAEDIRNTTKEEVCAAARSLLPDTLYLLAGVRSGCR